ncbi:Uncharacterised protein [Klebsiella pneumoniae subsp. ozaenae]|uniref:Uncharacterized protein n=1 Tax=Klebsiella pneumoniae subsp. ozaenae TaxID=574 RepID=A0A377ZJ87_KLEPO|nr:Uncharacterised protein [Klebsiella pneumoniae subsp. ozaenae]
MIFCCVTTTDFAAAFRRRAGSISSRVMANRGGEDGLPLEVAPAASCQQRGQRRRQSYQRHNGGEDAVRALGRIVIGDHRLPGNGRGTDANRLQKAQRQHQGGVVHPQHPQTAGPRKSPGRSAAPVYVHSGRQRSPEQLAQREAGEEQAQAGANGGGGGVEILLHGGKRRQVHIGGPESPGTLRPASQTKNPFPGCDITFS